MSRAHELQSDQPDETRAGDTELVLGPFTTRVYQVAGKRTGAEYAAGQDGMIDMEGIKPRLPLAMIYHNVRRVGMWDQATKARVALAGRLVANGVPKKVAKSLSWRLLENALCSCEGECGFDASILSAELDALLAYGEQRPYSEVPSQAEITTAMKDRDLLFPSEASATQLPASSTRLPTTVMLLYRRLGLWELAMRVLELRDPDRGELGDHSTSAAWRLLGCFLSTFHTVDNLREALGDYLRRQK